MTFWHARSENNGEVAHSSWSADYIAIFISMFHGYYYEFCCRVAWLVQVASRQVSSCTAIPCWKDFPSADTYKNIYVSVMVWAKMRGSESLKVLLFELMRTKKTASHTVRLIWYVSQNHINSRESQYRIPCVDPFFIGKPLRREEKR